MTVRHAGLPRPSLAALRCSRTRRLTLALAALALVGCGEFPPLVPFVDLGPRPVDEPDVDVDVPDMAPDGRVDPREVGVPDTGPPIDAEVDEAVPRPEVCDGADNDLDGRVDEGLAVEACEGGTGACAYMGETGCVDGEPVCVGQGAMPTAELCNGIDDDCDEFTDEGFPNLGQACGVGEGVCRGTGVYICLPDGMATVCDAEELLASRAREICDGLDNDCDGRFDEVEGSGPEVRLAEPCEDIESDGICAEGTRRCMAAEGAAEPAWTECTYPEDTSERCNNLDDDCDGNTDESFAQVGLGCDLVPNVQPALVDCPDRGVLDCAPDGTRAVCRPDAEARCDGVDENCDGVVDDGAVCGNALANACRAWLAWTNEDIGDVVEMWGACPQHADWSDTLSCNGAPSAGRPFAEIAIGGDVDAEDDRLGVSWQCDGPGLDPIAAYAQRSCRIYLGAGPVDAAPAEPSPTWGPCPAEPFGARGMLSCTTGDSQFRPMPLPVDIDASAVLGIAFRCTPVDGGGLLPEGILPGPTAASLQRSVEVLVAWADADVADGEIDWEAVCAPGGDGNSATTCVSSGGDGEFHTLRFIADLNAQDRLAIGLRPRVIE